MTTKKEINSRKNTKGKAINPWEEIKKNFHTRITPTAKKKLQEAAAERGTSIAELIEEFARTL